MLRTHTFIQTSMLFQLYSTAIFGDNFQLVYCLHLALVCGAMWPLLSSLNICHTNRSTLNPSDYIGRSVSLTKIVPLILLHATSQWNVCLDEQQRSVLNMQTLHQIILDDRLRLWQPWKFNMEARIGMLSSRQRWYMNSVMKCKTQTVGYTKYIRYVTYIHY